MDLALSYLCWDPQDGVAWHSGRGPWGHSGTDCSLGLGSEAVYVRWRGTCTGLGSMGTRGLGGQHPHHLTVSLQKGLSAGNEAGITSSVS